MRTTTWKRKTTTERESSCGTGQNLSRWPDPTVHGFTRAVESLDGNPRRAIEHLLNDPDSIVRGSGECHIALGLPFLVRGMATTIIRTAIQRLGYRLRGGEDAVSRIFEWEREETKHWCKRLNQHRRILDIAAGSVKCHVEDLCEAYLHPDTFDQYNCPMGYLNGNDSKARRRSSFPPHDTKVYFDSNSEGGRGGRGGGQGGDGHGGRRRNHEGGGGSGGSNDRAGRSLSFIIIIMTHVHGHQCALKSLCYAQAQMTVVAEASNSLRVSSTTIMLLQPPSHAANIQDVREVVVETREAQEISESERHLRENRNTMLARS
mmetsp:Transcript_9554/g.18635  ORF Transcript_9554/g.18635 Transcript_9554/m.18635 type:complete len:319 (+) Transcript_9554:2086-3042(+)